MAELKTRPNKQNVTTFIAGIKDARMRSDCRKVARMMRSATGKRARMWGDSIVGFGTYHYQYASGREGKFMLCGFSPRKRDLTVYVMPGFSKFGPLLKKLGKHKTGKSCLYLRSLDEIDENVLSTLIDRSVKLMRKKYETD